VCVFTEHLFLYRHTFLQNFLWGSEHVATKFDTYICLTDQSGMLKDSVGIK
jgi:hypothetical protein